MLSIRIFKVGPVSWLELAMFFLAPLEPNANKSIAHDIICAVDQLVKNRPTFCILTYFILQGSKAVWAGGVSLLT